jgi:hypothetical protein
MTLSEAIEEIRQVGTLRVEDGKLKLRFPETQREHLAAAIEALRQNRQAALQRLSDVAATPPLTIWPESLRDLAQERAITFGDPARAHREVWLSWEEWKARELNRLFLDQGSTGQSGRITAETVRRGEFRARPKGPDL